MKPRTINAKSRAGGLAAAALEEKLARQYEAALTAAGKRAAQAFVSLTSVVTAAADKPEARPTLDEVLNAQVLAASAQARTRATRQRMARETAGEIIPSSNEEARRLVGPLLGDLIDRQAGVQAERLVKGSQDAVAGLIEQAFREGWSVPRTAMEIKSTFAELSKVQSTMLARTDLVSIANDASLASAKAMGEAAPRYKTWLTAGDAKVRQDHVGADGQSVPVGQAFDVGGEAMMYPGDPAGSDGNTINCRCTFVYADSPNLQDEHNTTNLGARDWLAEAVTAAAEEVDEVPWHIEDDNAECDGYAVVKDSDGEIAGCHESRDAAEAQVAALYANEDAHAETPWKAVLCVEGLETEDGRMFQLGSVRWRTPPLPLMALFDTPEAGHDGAQLAGRIDRVYREGAQIIGEGVFDTNEVGVEAARMVKDGMLTGVSVDSIVELYELKLKPGVEVDEMGYPIAMEGEPQLANPYITVFLEAMLLGATVTPMQAIHDATIQLVASGEEPLHATFHNPVFAASKAQQTQQPAAKSAAMANSLPQVRVVQEGRVDPRLLLPEEHDGLEELGEIIAAGFPTKPPASWFEKPKFTEPTPLTVSPEGYVSGHVAEWNLCHTSIQNRCVLAEPSKSGYAYFHTGTIETAEGDMVRVGRITAGAPHADVNALMTPAKVSRHYDNSGFAGAYVVLYDDEFGPVAAGCVNPDITESQLVTLRAHPPSGDWRKIRGNMEMLGILCVNHPGFPVAAIRASADGEEEVFALISGGYLPGCDDCEEKEFEKELAAIHARIEGPEAEMELLTSRISAATEGIQHPDWYKQPAAKAPVAVLEPEAPEVLAPLAPVINVTVNVGKDGDLEPGPMPLADVTDREISYRVGFFRDTGYWPAGEQGGKDLTPEQWDFVVNSATHLVDEPESAKSVMLRERLVAKGLLVEGTGE